MKPQMNPGSRFLAQSGKQRLRSMCVRKDAFSRLVKMLLCALCLSVPLVAVAADWNIDQLMSALAQVKPGRASFVEKKTLSLLDRPIESSGELSYSPPDRLEKRTIKPKPESMLVEGGVLTFQRGQQKHTMQLAEYPELTGFIDSIRGTLAGDRKTLERSFRLKLEGPAERWLLTLLPINPKMATSVHLIRIAGMRDDMRSIEVIQTDGDRSLMTVERIR
jgi:outer membrane lipoprotein-sorting protein